VFNVLELTVVPVSVTDPAAPPAPIPVAAPVLAFTAPVVEEPVPVLETMPALPAA
jgi:hypothetical protein